MFLYLLTVTDINLFVDWLDICIYLVFLQITKGCSRLVVASDKVYQLLPMVDGSLRVPRLLPPLKLVAMI
jgi:hypothetical protein